jgi:hypothetical protein
MPQNAFISEGKIYRYIFSCHTTYILCPVFTTWDISAHIFYLLAHIYLNLLTYLLMELRPS